MSPAPADLGTLYGDDFEPREGVLHVTSVAQTGDGLFRVIRIGPGAPQSDADARSLAATRARADAVVITGKILRDEPALRYGLPEDLARWRAEQLGRRQLPKLAVLTRGGDLDLAHGALHSDFAPLVYTDAAFTARIGERARLEGVDVVTMETLSLRRVVTHLGTQGARTISVEAGPSTARDLYVDPVVVDELLLSVFEGPARAVPLGGPLFTEDALALRFERVVRTRHPSASGTFRIERWLRRHDGA